MSVHPTGLSSIHELRKDDILIAFMGPTGVGKSYFIDLLTGQSGKRAGHTLKSVTADIQATRVRHPKYGDRVVLVDTPGFDDTTRTDMEILAMISDWLAKTYKSDVKLTGLIYLHRITDNRMAGSPYKNLRMFGNLCGDDATTRVILVSTMWERVDPAVGAKREGQLPKTYKSDVKLTGLIYLHRITDNRMAGSPYKNLRMFGNLCGDDATTRVILVSTMWERVDPAVGAKREGQLREEFWKNLIDKGSGVDRLQRSDPKEAWRIVNQLINRGTEREKVLLQEEIVDLERRLNETEAGKTLYTQLQKMLSDQKETLKSLLAQVEKSDDPKLKKELEKEYKKIQDQFEKTFTEVAKLKIPLGRRIMMLFFGKRAHAKAIKIAEK
ncbi:hypothetical protein AN958_12143 [Leucoagaricus sp. SymC.cos]|nr:hypothetical protein AN958_12143 [Leucoagaricus sp. SymC.cos]